MVPPGARSVLLCRYFERGGKGRLAPNVVVSSPERTRSLAGRFNRLEAVGGRLPARCAESLGNRVDLFFEYPDGKITSLTVVLGGCGMAMRGSLRTHLTPSLRELLVKLTSRR